MTTDVEQLPWSTSNEDLVELFTTIGKVERAEIQYEANGRSRGTGVVQFDTADNAETSIGLLSPMICRLLLMVISKILWLPIWWSSSRIVLRQVQWCRR